METAKARIGLLLLVLLQFCFSLTAEMARAQASIEAGVHAGAEFEHGGYMGGANAYLDLGLPVKLGGALDYYSMTTTVGFAQTHTFNLYQASAELLLDPLPRSWPVRPYLGTGVTLNYRSREWDCSERECPPRYTRYGKLFVGTSFLTGRLHPFLQVQALRGPSAYHIVAGGLRFEL